MNTASFDDLVEEVSYWWCHGEPPDWVRITDSDRLRYLPNIIEKRKWLRKAKVESLRRTIQERVDAIAEAREHEEDSLVEVLLEAFPEDLKNYGTNLSIIQQKNWIDRASMAACGMRDEITTRDPVIYFVSAEDGLVKIGHSTHFHSRLRTLQTSHPAKLKILLVTLGSRDDEKELHQKFANQRVRGEWFNLDETIKDYIRGRRKQTL